MQKVQISTISTISGFTVSSGMIIVHQGPSFVYPADTCLPMIDPFYVMQWLVYPGMLPYSSLEWPVYADSLEWPVYADTTICGTTLNDLFNPEYSLFC